MSGRDSTVRELLADYTRPCAHCDDGIESADCTCLDGPYRTMGDYFTAAFDAGYAAAIEASAQTAEAYPDDAGPVIASAIRALAPRKP